jgi:hypothetical protein
MEGQLRLAPFGGEMPSRNFNLKWFLSSCKALEVETSHKTFWGIIDPGTGRKFERYVRRMDLNYPPFHPIFRPNPVQIFRLSKRDQSKPMDMGETC